MSFRSNCDPKLAQYLRAFVECSFGMVNKSLDRSADWSANIQLISDPSTPVAIKSDLLEEALSEIRTVSPDYRLCLTPYFLLEEFFDSSDYGAPAEKFLFLEPTIEWLAIYSPFQLSCLAYYALMPGSVGEYDRIALWKEAWWNLPMLIHSKSDALHLDRLVVE